MINHTYQAIKGALRCRQANACPKMAQPALINFKLLTRATKLQGDEVEKKQLPWLFSNHL